MASALSSLVSHTNLRSLLIFALFACFAFLSVEIGYNFRYTATDAHVAAHSAASLLLPRYHQQPAQPRPGESAEEVLGKLRAEIEKQQLRTAKRQLFRDEVRTLMDEIARLKANHSGPIKAEDLKTFADISNNTRGGGGGGGELSGSVSDAAAAAELAKCEASLQECRESLGQAGGAEGTGGEAGANGAAATNGNAAAMAGAATGSSGSVPAAAVAMSESEMLAALQTQCEQQQILNERLQQERERLAAAVAHYSRSTTDCNDTGVALSVRAKASDGGDGAAPVAGTAPDMAVPRSAEQAVNQGLELYKKGRVRDALRRFEMALEMKPSEEEAQAALYNKACCHAFREEGVQAQEALREALRYGLQFSVILSDPDMAAFRAMPEFRALQEEARQGGEEVGGKFRRDLKLIAEVQAPFRGVRRFLYVALGMAAGIATVITIPRFILAVQGGVDAPDLLTTSGNLAIDLGGGAAMVGLYLWEQRREEEQMGRVSRDETLSRLPLRLQSGKVVELVQLRGTTRPSGKVVELRRWSREAVQQAMTFQLQSQLVGTGAAVPACVSIGVQGDGAAGDEARGGKSVLRILDRTVCVQVILSGRKEAVQQAMKRAEGYRKQLQERGVLLVPVLQSKGGGVLAESKKKGFAAVKKPAATLESLCEWQEEFEEKAREAAAKRVAEADRRLKAEVVSPKEWDQWVRSQQKAEKVVEGSDAFIVLRLDGRVRKSGTGMPDWADLINELPPLDSLVSKLER
ncbi:unnamed protein product [Closterium sp. Naga37s-1]|nr:unnamed protein product [Closterium sp. Naga37s-1]